MVTGTAAIVVSAAGLVGQSLAAAEGGINYTGISLLVTSIGGFILGLISLILSAKKKVPSPPLVVPVDVVKEIAEAIRAAEPPDST